MNALKNPTTEYTVSNKIGYTGNSNRRMAKDQHGMVDHFRHLVMGPTTRLYDLDCVSNYFSVNQASEGSEPHAEKRQKLKPNGP